MLTLKEQERLAYISGDVHTATLLAQAEDAEDNTKDLVTRDELDDAYDDIAALQGRVDDLRGERDALQKQINEMLDVA